MEQLDTLEKAIDIFRSGDKAAASRLLAQQVTQNPKNDTAWMWLAASLPQPDQQFYCLRKAQAVNPANPATLEELNAFLGLDRPVHEPGSPINLPPPAPPVVQSDTPTGPLPQIKSGKRVLSRNQVLMLALLVVAILVVIAVLAFLVVTSDPNVLSPFLQSILGVGGLVILH